MLELWRVLRDPRVATVGVLLAGLAAGFGLVGAAYRSVAAIGSVAAQMPLVVSGGLVGVALVATSVSLLSVHLDRVEAAEERRQFTELLRKLRGSES